MPFERPTLPEIKARVQADMLAHLPDSDPALRRGNLEVLSAVEAGAVHGLYGLAEYLSRQILVDTAEASSLERHAGIWGIARKPATAAEGEAIFTGTDGAVIPAGAELKRADDVRYVVLAESTVAGGQATVQVRALQTGSAGNAAVNTGLTSITYLANINVRGKVATDGLGGGAEAESDAALRGRVLTRIQKPPQGGAAHDYVAWAKEVAGVTRAWVYPNRSGAGTVGVTFLMDDSETGPLPSPAEVAAVQAHIDELRPVCAAVTVFACEAQPVTFDIGLVPDTAPVRQAVADALADLIRNEAIPEGTLLISHVREAISQAAGETDHALWWPEENQVAFPGCLLTLGEITWS